MPTPFTPTEEPEVTQPSNSIPDEILKKYPNIDTFKYSPDFPPKGYKESEAALKEPTQPTAQPTQPQGQPEQPKGVPTENIAQMAGVKIQQPKKSYREVLDMVKGKPDNHKVKAMEHILKNPQDYEFNSTDETMMTQYLKKRGVKNPMLITDQEETQIDTQNAEMGVSPMDERAQAFETFIDTPEGAVSQTDFERQGQMQAQGMDKTLANESPIEAIQSFRETMIGGDTVGEFFEGKATNKNIEAEKENTYNFFTQQKEKYRDNVEVSKMLNEQEEATIDSLEAMKARTKDEAIDHTLKYYNKLIDRAKKSGNDEMVQEIQNKKLDHMTKLGASDNFAPTLKEAMADGAAVSLNLGSLFVGGSLLGSAKAGIQKAVTTGGSKLLGGATGLAKSVTPVAGLEFAAGTAEGISENKEISEAIAEGGERAMWAIGTMGLLEGAIVTPSAVKNLFKGNVPDSEIAQIMKNAESIKDPVAKAEYLQLIAEDVADGISKDRGLFTKIKDSTKEMLSTSTDPTDLTFRAIKPRIIKGKTLMNAKVDMQKANEAIVEYGRKPQNVKEYAEAVTATKKEVWEKEIAPKLEVGSTKEVDAEIIAGKIRQMANDPALRRLDPNAINRLETIADNLVADGATIDVPTAEKLKQLINGELNGQFGQFNVSDVEKNAKKLITKELGTQLDDILSNIPGEFAEAKKKYGALRAIEDDVQKRYVVFERANPESLVDSVSKVSGLGDIAKGILARDVSEISKGGFKLVAGRIQKRANDANIMVKRSFDKMSKGKGKAVPPEVKKEPIPPKPTTPNEKPFNQAGTAGSAKTDNLAKKEATKPVSSIPKELDPLVNEAKNYDSFNDFVKNIGKKIKPEELRTRFGTGEEGMKNAKAFYNKVNQPQSKTIGQKAKDFFANPKKRGAVEVSNIAEDLGFKKGDPLTKQADDIISKAKTEQEAIDEFVNSKMSVHRPPDIESGSRIDDLTGSYGDDIYTPEGLRYYGDPKDIVDKESYSIIRSIKGNPEKEVKIYRAVPKGETSKFNQGDWVTISNNYAKRHGESVLNNKYDILEETVKAKDLYGNADSLAEYGYFPNNTKNLKKSDLKQIIKDKWKAKKK